MRNLYAELAEYTNRTQILVQARCSHASSECAWQFEKHKDNPIEHYRENDLYIFASTRYQMAMQEAGLHQWYQDIIKQYGWKNGLDLGGGIGEQTILAIEAGVNYMKFVEVGDSESYKYAKWRFKKNLVAKKIQMMTHTFRINQDFDFIVAMDVFEHMEHPQPVIEAIAKHTKYLFCNPTEIKYNWLYPQHISEFRLNPYFRKIDNYLYERT